MILTPEQRTSLLVASGPLRQWLAENCHPHCEAKVDQSTVELLESCSVQHNAEFVKP